MKIAAIEAIPYSIPYLHPLHFASGSVHEADHVLDQASHGRRGSGHR